MSDSTIYFKNETSFTWQVTLKYFILAKTYKNYREVVKEKPDLYTPTLTPQWNSPWRGEGAYLTKKFRPLRQLGKFVGARQLRSNRANRSFLCQCKGFDSK